jgi:hypothetical protein
MIGSSGVSIADRLNLCVIVIETNSRPTDILFRIGLATLLRKSTTFPDSIVTVPLTVT